MVRIKRGNVARKRRKKILQLTIIFVVLGALVFLLGYLRDNVETFLPLPCNNEDASNYGYIGECVYDVGSVAYSENTGMNNIIDSENTEGNNVADNTESPIRIPIALPMGTTHHMRKFHNGGTTSAYAAEHNHPNKVGHDNDVFHYHVNT